MNKPPPTAAVPPTEAGRAEPIAPYIVLGLVQGLALWALYHSVGNRPGPIGPAFAAVLQFSLAGPLAWYLSAASFGSARARAGVAVLVGSLLAALGVHAGATGDALGFDRIVASLVLGYVIVALAAGVDWRAKALDYPRLFRVAWRNALLVPIAALLTGIFWVLLWAANWLMSTVGIDALDRLLRQPAFNLVVCSTVFGLATGLALRRADTLVAVRRLWLALNAWFLPLALAFAVVWLAGLAATGTTVLFETKRAAFYLFWFAALAVTFTNAAFQDGQEPPAYPGWLSRMLTWSWVAMPPLVLIALWALWLRVAQHGWTPDRIWAALVGVLLTVHACGYALSLRSRGRWMRTLPRTNVAAAALEVVALVALLSPLADARRVSVASQVARLESGAVAPQDFDWGFLAHQAGSYGKRALERLASAGADVPRPIQERAAAVLREGAPKLPPDRQDEQKALAALKEKILVLPTSSRPDPALLAWLARPMADWRERTCIGTPERCALWLVDLDGDGKDEAILLWESEQRIATAALYAIESEGWRKQGDLRGRLRSLQAWVEAIEQNKIELVSPRWRDIKVDGVSLRAE
jgi:hypothetical protein